MENEEHVLAVASKECSKCYVQFPLNEEYFHKDKSKPDGYKRICKMCRKEEREERENRAIDERIKALEAEGIKVLDVLASRGSSIPHMAETFQRIIDVYGGSGGFAQHYLANYLSTPPGSATRQKMLDTVIRLNMKVSESGAAQKSLEEITDEELDIEIQQTAKALLLYSGNNGVNDEEMENSAEDDEGKDKLA